MKRKNIFIILFIVFLLSGVGVFEYEKINNNKNTIDLEENTNIKIPQEQVKLLQSLVGLESKNMKILDNPLRIEGSFYIPENTVSTYINHYLNNSKNTDVEDVKVIINKNGMTIKGQYKLFSYIKTPIDVDILPSLTEDGDLKLQLTDIRVLNLSLNENIIDAIVESWFSDLKYVSVDNSNVVINKEFFKDNEIKGISVKEDYLVVDISMKL